MNRVAALTAAAILLGAGSAAAHHGWNRYNSDQTLNLSGEIQQVSYQAPHVTIRLKTADKLWLAVLAPPSRMERRGLVETDLKVGLPVRVEGYAHRETADELRAERISLGEKTVELR